jgi:FemAB-related protein (PEP-CTERM system-associated)
MTSANGSKVRIMRAEHDVSLWSGLVNQLGDARLAHAPEWLAAVRHPYGHEPLYLMAEDGAGHGGVLPAFVVRRPWFGTVVASMPFLDTGGPCASSAGLADSLVERLMVEAREIGATSVELRCSQRLNLPTPPLEHKVTLTRALSPDADRLWRQLDGSVRNQIRKAERSGLTVEFGGGEKLDEFYAIFATRMRELGSPVHGQPFFSAVVDAFGNRARVALVRKGTTPIGGLIALAFKDVLAVPWAACLSEFFAMCPNMLLYWETIRQGCADGFGCLDFGRSTRGAGTYHFKRQWGSREEPLFWYSIPIDGRLGRPVPSDGRSAAVLAESWRHLPIAVTRYLGPRIRRYLTQ